MIGQVLVFGFLGSLLSFFQSTWLTRLALWGAVPDLALILLVFSSWRYGPMVGQISGFVIGITMDTLSLAPLGFHSLIFSLLGYVIGRMKGTVPPDRIFLPFLVVLIASIVKRGGGYLVASIFSLQFKPERFFVPDLAVELLLNALLAPLVFFLATLLAQRLDGRRGGFQ